MFRPDPPTVAEVQAGGGSGQGVGPACISLGGKGHRAQDTPSLSASVTHVTDFGSVDPHDPVLTHKTEVYQLVRNKNLVHRDQEPMGLQQIA